MKPAASHRRSVGALATCFAIAAVLAAGCAAHEDNDDDYLACEGQCDGVNGVRVSATWVPVDGFVRAVAPAGQLAVTPDDGVEVNGSGNRVIVQFARPGFYTLSRSQGERGVVVRVSDDGPVVELTDPAPGAMITAGPGSMEISGRFSDPLGGSLEARIGDRALSLSSGGEFSTTVQAEFGVNVVDLVAVDAAGNEFRAPRSFLVASDYSGASAPALVAFDPEAMSFLADTVNAVLPGLIKIPAIPGPIGSRLGHDVFFDGAKIPGKDGHPGSMRLEFEVSGDRLRVRYVVTGTAVLLGHIDGLLDSQGRVEIDNPTITATLGFPTTGGPFAASVEALEVTEDRVNLDLSGLLGIIDGFFVERVRKEFELRVEENAAPIINSVLGSIEGQLEVDAGALGASEPIQVDYRIGKVEVVGDSVQLWVDGRVIGSRNEIAAPRRPR